jgi:hypothetical protein
MSFRLPHAGQAAASCRKALPSPPHSQAPATNGVVGPPVQRRSNDADRDHAVAHGDDFVATGSRLNQH